MLEIWAPCESGVDFIKKKSICGLVDDYAKPAGKLMVLVASVVQSIVPSGGERRKGKD